MRKTLAAGVAAAALAAVASPASAAITCHQTIAPPTTVQTLVNSLSAGQTGCLRAGTYAGNVALNKSVTLTSYGGENAIVRGKVEVTAAGAAVTKLVLDGTDAATNTVEGSVDIRAADVTLRDNDIRNPPSSCVTANYDQGATVVDRAVIERNRIHDCGNAPTSGYGYGVSLWGGSDTLVQNNVVYDNAQGGVFLYGGTRATVKTNTIDANGTGIVFADPSYDSVAEWNVTAFSTGTFNISRPIRGPLYGSGNVARDNCGWKPDGTGGFHTSTTGYSFLNNITALPGYEPTRAAKNFAAPVGTNCWNYGAPADVAGLTPDTTIESGPAVSGRSATFTFSSSKPGSTFECKLDGPSGTSAYQTCTNPTAYSGLQPGSYTFRVRAKVGANTDATPASIPFTIVVTCHKIAQVGTAIDTAEELHAALVSGETGCFRTGTYTTTTTPTTAPVVSIDKPGITMRSYPGEIAQVNGPWRGTGAANGFVLEALRLNIHGSSNGVGITFSGDNVVVRSNDITAANGWSICLHPRQDSSLNTPNSFLIERNRIHDCGVAPMSRADYDNDELYPHANTTHGIYVDKGTGTIRGNVIYDNNARGIQLYRDADGVLIENNTVDRNGQGGQFGGCFAGSTDCGSVDLHSDNNTMRRNVFTNAYNRWNIEEHGPSGTGNVATNNCVFASSDQVAFNANGGIETSMPGVSVSNNPIQNPSYANRSAPIPNFKVTNSACRDTGDPANPRRGAPDQVADPALFPWAT